MPKTKNRMRTPVGYRVCKTIQVLLWYGALGTAGLVIWYAVALNLAAWAAAISAFAFAFANTGNVQIPWLILAVIPLPAALYGVDRIMRSVDVEDRLPGALGISARFFTSVLTIAAFLAVAFPGEWNYVWMSLGMVAGSALFSTAMYETLFGCPACRALQKKGMYCKACGFYGVKTTRSHGSIIGDSLFEPAETCYFHAKDKSGLECYTGPPKDKRPLMELVDG